MSPLTQAKKDLVRARALAEGIDPDAAVASVERMHDQAESERAVMDGDEGDEDEGTTTPPAPTKAPEDKPLYQWHAPFVLVRELRERLGLVERIPGDDLTCAEFMSKSNK
jgi:hypothetical protein